jgi:6-phosphogluconolactonase
MQGKTKKLNRGILLAFLVIGAAALWVPPAMADDAKKAVYVQSNTAPFNTVLVFDQNHDGTLTPAGSVMTGGQGKPTGNPPFGIPFLDSAGSVTLSDNGRSLFVVNAGDNTVSSLRVTAHGLQLADVVPTFGSRPISATTHGHLLYVLNSDTGSASISGYRIDGHGGLTPIPGSLRPTSDPANDLPGQVQFDATGKLLAVSDRQPPAGSGVLDFFAIGHNGAAGPAVPHPSSDETPYGIAFTHDNVMTVSNEHGSDPALSSTSSYDVTRHGDVTPIDTELAHAGGACWNQITNDDKYVLVTSPFTSNINSWRIERNGELTPVNGNSIVYTGDGGALLDESLTHESKYLYVLNSAGFVSSKLDEFRVNKDGTVTHIGVTPSFDGSASGTAAW